jgi:predicted nucleotide-binding protein
VFLGYCSKSKSTAQAIHLFLREKLQVTVLDWAMDFAGGGMILEEIERASQNCSCGIFLFTKDDPLDGEPDRAAPRDNVVFEAGYFASSKGHTKALIVREEGAKMPADIGGSIYLLLRDKDDIQPIQSALRDFVEQRL